MLKFLLASLFAAVIAASGLDGNLRGSVVEDTNDASISARQLTTLPTITKLADDNPPFDTLSAALKATGLDVTLRGPGRLTVLAHCFLWKNAFWTIRHSHFLLIVRTLYRLSPSSVMPPLRLSSKIPKLSRIFSCTMSSVVRYLVET